jgi:hypothetical protein
MGRAKTHDAHPHYREKVKAEITTLEQRIGEIAATLTGLNTQGHQTADAYRELERMRERLDLLKRMDEAA